MLQIASRSIPGSQHPYEDRVLVDEKLGLFAVADGVTLSSQGSGGIAAELALGLLQENFKGDIVEAVKAVHRAAVERRRKDKDVGETTLTAITVSDERLQAANVGDSPAFLVSGGRIRNLFQEDRSPHGYITQVIGAPETVRVHSTSLDLRARDVVIVASDGVGHVLIPSMMDQFASKPDADQIADAIIEEALAQRSGYDDDKSVIAIRIVA